MNLKTILTNIVVLLVIRTTEISVQSRELLVTKPEINCFDEPYFNNFKIATNLKEDSDNFNITILNKCKIEPVWMSRDNQYSQCIITQRVFEGEDNIRRAFRFSNTGTSKSEKIQIKDIRLYYDKLIADSALSETNMVLSPGESRDIFIDYECHDKDETRSLSVPWYNMKVQVEMHNGKVVNFEMIKICTATYTSKVDLSHLLVIIIGLLIIYFSAQDYLKSDVEVVLLNKFHEMRNPENLTLISFIIALLFGFLGIVGFFPIFAYYMSILTGVLSIALVLQAICYKANLLLYLDSASYEIPYLGSISIMFLICIGCGVFLEFLWITSENWFFSDLIAITIAFTIIRLFRLTSFKWILIMYVAAYSYNIIWMRNFSNHFGENYKLTTVSPISLPVKIICPELSSSPFKACSYMSIADVVLPGLLLPYSKMFDVLHNSNDFYFNAGFIGLIVGFLIDVIVYYSKSLPTPCFLYTGPLLLIISLLQHVLPLTIK